MKNLTFTPTLRLFAACFALCCSAEAANYTVTNTLATGYGSLQRAVADAAGSAGTDTILFDSQLSGLSIQLDETLVLDQDLTIDASALAAGIKIYGNGRVVEVTAGPTVVLRNLELWNGWATQGGGIYNAGTLTLDACTIANNGDGTAFGGGPTSQGGGIYNAGTLTLNRCLLTGNIASVGAAIYNQSFATLVVDRSTLTANDGVNGTGGIHNLGTLTLTNTVVSGNTTSGFSDPNLSGAGALSINVLVDIAEDEDDGALLSGAGISLREAVKYGHPGTLITFVPALAGQTLTLTPARGGEIVLGQNLTIDASGLPGGMTLSGGNTSRIFSVSSGRTVTLKQLTFTGGNGAGVNPGKGGAIYNASSSLTLENCSFQGNSVPLVGGDGGGLYNDSASPTLNNCAFQGNRAQYGGGIFNFLSSATLNNCSLQGNRAQYGGGIYNYSASPTLNNCIIWNHKDSSGTGTANSSIIINIDSTPTYSHCLIQGRNLSLTGTGNLDGTQPANNPRFVREVDPELAPTTGGDLRLLTGSPAIDAGDNSKNPTSTDLAGKPRVIDGNQDSTATIDLGAYELPRVLYVKSGATGTQDGTSWTNAFPHLQSALAASQPDDDIWVATGTYYPDQGTEQIDNERASTFALRPRVAIYGGFAGTETLLAQRNPAKHPTILSGDIDQNDASNGDAGNAYHVLTASGAAISAASILDGFIITAGNANQSSPQIGGGILCEALASPTINNCSVQGNRAEFGGGISNVSASPTFNNCSVQGNRAQYGGGIDNVYASPTFNNCSVQGNRALYGGGINNFYASPTLNNCIIWNNKDNSGTGTSPASVYNIASNPTYSHCLIQGLNLILTGTGNLDGTQPANNPLFVRAVDPELAPTTGGDLRLLTGSPAIDAGDNSKNKTSTDLAGKPRIIDGNQDNTATIDLGAYEKKGALYVKSGATGTQNGTSWTNAFPDLQSALAASQPDDEIWVATGIYYPDQGTGQINDLRESTFALRPDVAIYGGFAGTETLLAQRNPAIYPTTLSGDIDQNDASSGDANNAHHVLTASGAAISAATILDGFIITSGNATGGDSSTYSSGGGLCCIFSASPTLNNCSFQGNRAQNGGGIFNSSGTSPTFNNCSVQGNHAAVGGGIDNFSASPTFNNCSVQGNRAQNGGGIYNFSASPALNNCIIWNNKDSSGTGTANSSIINIASNPTYSHCLIQSLDLSLPGTGNLDGGQPANNPLFVREVDPELAPTTGGDLRLRPGSPAINAGSNLLNPTATDLGGRPRILNSTIDLGAYEWRRVFVDARIYDGNQDGTSWSHAITHLQSALSVSQPGDEIWVATGTYYPDQGTGQIDNQRASTFALRPRVAIYGGFAGTETLLSQRNPALFPTTLSGDIDQNDAASPSDPSGSGNTNNAYHVLTASGAAISAASILDGFIITAGNANGDAGSINSFGGGGGLYCASSASPILNNCSFRGNSALAGGGGIYNAFGTSPTLNNCSVQGNRAHLGGGIYNLSATPTLNNCSVQGNRAQSSGGGIYNDAATPTLNNCSVQGNRASFGGGIFNDRSSPTLNNCIIWHNKASPGTGTADSSIFEWSSTPTYSHCLIQGRNLSLTGSGNLDGTQPANNPLFVRAVDPELAPTTVGDLRLLTGSPAIETGDNSKNTTSTDLAGRPRFIDGNQDLAAIIDLGAYEGAVAATFALLHPTLTPTADANGNGMSDFGDYAAGGDPTASDDPTLRPKLSGKQLTFSFRDNAADITKAFQKSTTLLPGSWVPLVPTTDYTVSTATSSGGRTLQTLILTDSLLTNNPKIFFRQVFTESP